MEEMYAATVITGKLAEVYAFQTMKIADQEELR